MKCCTVKHSAVVDAPVTSIWRMLAEEFGLLHQYSNEVTDSRYLTEHRRGADQEFKRLFPTCLP